MNSNENKRSQIWDNHAIAGYIYNHTNVVIEAYPDQEVQKIFKEKQERLNCATVSYAEAKEMFISNREEILRARLGVRDE